MRSSKNVTTREISCKFYSQIKPMIFAFMIIVVSCCTLIAPTASLSLETPPTKSSYGGSPTQSPFMDLPAPQSTVTGQLNDQNNSNESDLELFGKINERLTIIAGFLVFLCICIVCALILFLVILRHLIRGF